MSISLCLIAKNEEGNLKKCLRSFGELADEMIVADTGSTDKTKKIAKENGAKVFDYKWCDDFSAARNFAISKATKKWVMVVDADDVIDKKSTQQIKDYLKKIPSDAKIILLPYIYTKMEEGSGNLAWLPRLWRTSEKLKYISPIHEYLNFSKVPCNAVKKLDAPIVHQKPNQDYRPGLERNVKILNSAIKKKPDDLRILYYLVHDNRHLGNFEEALYWCEKYFEAKPEDPIYTNKVFNMQGICHLELGQEDLAQISFLLAIGATPLLIEPYLELGDMYYRQKRYEAAIQMYRCAENCEVPKASGAFFNRAVYDYFAERKLAYILKIVGREKEALKYAKKALKFCPNDTKLKNHIKKLEKAT